MAFITIILWGIAVLVGLVLLYLIVIIFSPIFPVSEQPLHVGASPRKEDQETPACRTAVNFQVGGTQLSAWLYLPEDISAPVPGIILSHGFGGTKHMILESYALRFVQAGMAVLTYDYRYFGESGDAGDRAV